MIDSKTINETVKRLLASLPPGVAALPKDLEAHCRQVLQDAFQKMDLVTREEFDAQTRVLERARTKLEALEKKLSDLEND